MASVFTASTARLTDDSVDIAGQLHEQEITASVKEIKRGKAPGLDGLPGEFYCTFWYFLKEDFLEMANEGFHWGALSHSQQTGIIRLLYRSGERYNLANWRPITLLNTDYKIIAKSLANRLKSVLSRVIHTDQTCSVPERSIADNCALIRDCAYYCEETQTSAAI